jgi:peptidoglycan/LPS O-acetylase OafA/YrhL
VKTGREIKPLTSVRFFAALMVLCSHSFDIWTVLFPGLRGYSHVASLGDVGVGVFFVLSGYILAYTYAAEFGSGVRLRSWLTFVRRRIARIWPLHVATLAALALVAGMVSAAGHARLASDVIDLDWRDLPFQLTLTHAWKIWTPHEVLPWNRPSWSISAEWFAYLLCPLLLWVLVRSRLRAGAALVVALVAVQFAVFAFANPNSAVTLDSGFSRIVGLFSLGAFCQIALQRSGARIPAPEAVVVGLVVTLAVLLGPSYAEPGRFGVILASGLLIVPLAQAAGPLARAMSARPLVFLGRASFAMYMTHDLILRATRGLLEHPSVVGAAAPLRFGAMCALYALVIATACFTYLWFERPAERLLRGSSRRTVAQPEPVGSLARS